MTLQGPTPNSACCTCDRFGGSVAAAGDVNGDGYADLLVAATDVRKVYLYYGSLAAQAPIQVPFVPCPVTIPADSEIGEAKESGFWVKVKGGRPLFDPSVLVVNSPVSIFDKTIEPDAKNTKFTVEEQRADGYALEGELEKQGRKYYFVDRSVPCAPKAWLACRMVTIEKKNAEYASRVCRSLVPQKK